MLLRYLDIPRDKMLCFHFSRGKGIKKKKKNLLSCTFFSPLLIVRSIDLRSLRNVKIPLLLEFVKQHVYANRYIFL